MAIPARIRTESPQEQQKRWRDTIVDHLLVLYGKNYFHGDERSQERMMRAVAFARENGVEEIEWISAQGKTVKLTPDDLAQVLARAMQKQYEIFLRAKKGKLTRDDVRGTIEMWENITGKIV